MGDSGIAARFVQPKVSSQRIANAILGGFASGAVYRLRT